MTEWSLQDAKAKFSELVNTCQTSGAQMVTRHGEPAVVVIAVKDYEKLKKPRGGLAYFLAAAPRVELNTARSREEGRELEL
jgi:prevent-host-death family protein